MFIVLGIFALVIVTTVTSFAFFTYSRVGNTTTTITSGDIEFTYIEGDNASIEGAFPIPDSVGAVDTSHEYTFDVKMSSSSTSNKINYNVILLDDNKETNANYFTNEQIKFALIKNGTYVSNTSSTEGVKLSSISGFDEEQTTGEGVALANQEIAANTTDTYKLRIWISDDVDYSNTELTSDNTDSENDAQNSVGKYNGYKYSLKVKITSEILMNTIKIDNTQINGRTLTADLSDEKGLVAYVITQSSDTPTNDEWIEISNETALVTNKSISYKVSSNGTYYLHVKNKNNFTLYKKIDVVIAGEKATTKIEKLASTNTNELRKDIHSATGQQNFATTEYRYWGKSPNNYVSFNNELWRIIGIFDVDDGTGKIERRMKIIRSGSIGNYSWDSSASNVNQGLGVNAWNASDAMNLLNNGPYYKRTTGNCYNNTSNKITSCNFTTTGLTSAAKEMIGNAKWYLGSFAASAGNYYVNTTYNLERGYGSSKGCSSANNKNCTDTVTRVTSWVGKVGLMYPSDYGYAANISCAKEYMSWYHNSCAGTDWLAGLSEYTISATQASYGAYTVYGLGNSGSFTTILGGYGHALRPVVYLLPDIMIVDGVGTSKEPFILM